ncbi:MAG: 1-acyl-sn-glycerol-3-phosphate acyltransferase [Acidimicrobiaceae bacterium]|nr:1-acyl-sn-glycerol-3-phosphate acyltransferase [Acidimicrobiaceae bacterium]
MSRSAYGRRRQDGTAGDDALHRSRQPLWGRLLYGVLWSMVLALCKVLFRLRVEGKDNFPTGPFILSPVHRSFIDTPIAGMATSRRLRFMGKESLWENRPLGVFLTVLGGFPVERGTADRTALRAATDVLALGEPLVMFPEGTRRTGDRVRRDDMLDGPAFVAARAGVPIVPIGLGGTVRALPAGSFVPRPRRVVVVVGEPIPPPAQVGGRVPRRAVSEVTDRLFVELGDLYVEARVLAGQESPQA